MVALPTFVIIGMNAPDLEQKDRKLYQIEQFRSPKSALTFPEVIAAGEQNWQPETQPTIFDLKAGEQEIWHRIRLPMSAEPVDLIADAGTLFFRQVDFYLVENDKLIASSFSGMDRPHPAEVPDGSRYLFRLKLEPRTNRTLYVRQAADFIFIRQLSLRTPDRDSDLMWLHDLNVGVVFGFLCGLILYNFAIAFRARHRLYTDYGLYLSATLFMAMWFNGKIIDLLNLSLIGFTIWIKILLLACFAIILSYLNVVTSFLNTAINFPRLHRYLRLSQIASLSLSPISLFISPTISFLLMATVVVLIAGLTIAVCLPRIHIPEINTFFIAVSGILFGAIVQLILAPATKSTLLGIDGLFLLGSAWGGFFLSTAMARQLDQMTRKSSILREAAAKKLPLTDVNAYLNDTFSGQFTPSKLEVTIMFVDTASFSRIAERTNARTLFSELSNRLEEITKIVLQHGGTIDRSLGDGVLCFFGHHSGLINSHSHVVQAFEAALEIQRHYIDDMYKSYEANQSRFPIPIRIGIHTDQVTIGNMGTSFHMDFTMVGNGVNFANRLETACAPMRIMVSEATRAALVAQKYQDQIFDHVMIAIKHHTDLVPAYEVNPHKNTPEKVAIVQRHFMEHLGDNIRDPRHSVTTTKLINASSIYGNLTVRDFSRRGFLLSGTQFLAQKSLITITLDTGSHTINQILADRFLTSFEIEVRWSRRNGDRFDHGVQVVGGHPEQWDFLYDLLRTISYAEMNAAS